jgi:hypothetical protein
MRTFRAWVESASRLNRNMDQAPTGGKKLRGIAGRSDDDIEFCLWASGRRADR